MFCFCHSSLDYNHVCNHSSSFSPIAQVPSSLPVFSYWVCTICSVLHLHFAFSNRYIEIFKSSMGQANAVFGNQRGGGGGMRPPMGMGGMMGRPCPYDRSDRFGGPMGPPGMMPGPMGPFGRGGRGGRNLKGNTYLDQQLTPYEI